MIRITGEEEREGNMRVGRRKYEREMRDRGGEEKQRGIKERERGGKGERETGGLKGGEKGGGG